MRTGVTFALLVALCVLLGPMGSIAPVAAAPSQSSSASDVSSTIIEIQVQRNGDARISIVTTVPVQGKNDTAGFKEAAKSFEVGEFKKNTLDAFRHAARDTSNATNRPMSIENIDRNASRHENVGRFVISFTWRNFAVVTDNGKYVRTNDSFSTTDGIWLSGLSMHQTLIIHAPPGYYIRSSPIPHQGQTLRWSGPRSFKPGFPNPNITYASSGSRDPPSQSPTPTPASTPTGSSVSPFLLAVGAAVLIVIGSIGIFAFSRRDRVLTNVTMDGGIGTDGVENPSISSSSSSSNPDPDPAPDPDLELDSDIESAVDPDPDSDTGTSDDGIDLGLLSDEERVERLLRQNDGRMKQANIVRETDWSDAKVSQLLSAMDEAGCIEKLRIGRENLISLSDSDSDSDS
jgi:uncharacterized membrane protein